MYLGIDIGGTKTLIAIIDDNWRKVKEEKIKTEHDYSAFLQSVKNILLPMREEYEFTRAVIAVPGLLDRDKGLVYALGNLPWKNEPIRDDLSSLLNCEVIIENDSRLAGLAVAQPFKEQYREILYITVSTGIGGALISNGKIVTSLRDMEIGKIPLMFDSKIQHWEDFASGRSIVENYGKKAKDIDDPKQWQEIGDKLAYGLAVVVSCFQPQAIVFGGGVGQFAKNFIPVVNNYFEQNLHSIVSHPELLIGRDAEEAVINGCILTLKEDYEIFDS